MIDRRKIAALLLVLGAALAVAGSFEGTYRTVYRGFGFDQSMTTTLWIVTTEPPQGGPRDAYHALGWPVVVAAVLMVVGAVLTMRERTTFVGRPVAMGAAGALAGIMFSYLLQVRREERVLSELLVKNGGSNTLDVLGGAYLLGAAAIIGLVGAVLAQQRRQRKQAVEAEEEKVVVHQLANDDDTPPFGIAVLDDEKRETP
ncbi:hypothetical protein [Lentzea flava]|uniref:Tryptophan-associated transmembrane protein (Trp_oprn_chp) n=1 Tax=Lentzea flava TaxID=103732 RepID=A0ABQ2UZ43_9PSEU|nr:hypothetical protein [Lentzea flava]MCP2202162.1 hypothetical protein [Lentzea flava]GGU57450.1 hypothetical protein GCM10010178_57350 [Lentzea flava]